MRVQAGGSATIVDVLARAATRTGTDFGFLMAQARSESGLRADAKAATSSARGLFQFTGSTWLDMVARHGAGHGGNHPALGWAADALKSGAAQAGSAVREAVLALRDDPDAASLMAGELAKDNAQGLAARLGRPVNAGEVHLAHFLGLGGATRFLRALGASPDAAAARVVPAAAAANRSVFYGRDGAARSLADVMTLMAGKVGAAGPRKDLTIARASETPTVARPERTLAPTLTQTGQARAAYLLLAELGG
jgi:hypothetical protein